MVVQGRQGTREVPASAFFTSFLETAVGPDELLVEVRFPKATGAGWAYEKFNRRAQDWAIVAVAVQLGASPGCALVNMGPTPLLAAGVIAGLQEGADASAAASRAAEGTQAPTDLHGDRDYRNHLARVLTERALRRAG
jgi:carbon-monoxide dehydrogenase medium subunit